jgi:putative PIN family toxin of toxin-antitoxin system
MRVVFDTNVVVSRFLSPSGAPARIFEMWERQSFQALVSPAILDEYQAALAYRHVARRHKMTQPEIAEVIEALALLAIVVEPATKLQVVKGDPEDDKFLECAIEGNADCIVTGDRLLLELRRFQGIEILSPAAFVAAFDR